VSDSGGPSSIGEALMWRIDRLTTEAEQHRAKAQFHLDVAAELEMKAIEFRGLAREIRLPLR